MGQETASRLTIAISVCRTYGSGLEWSDGDADPNIEWDNFGLFLGALGEYVVAAGDQEFLLEYLDDVDRRTAYVLETLLTDEGLYAARDRLGRAGSRRARRDRRPRTRPATQRIPAGGVTCYHSGRS